MRQRWKTGEGLHDPLEMVVREEREITVGVLLQSWALDWGTGVEGMEDEVEICR